MFGNLITEVLNKSVRAILQYYVEPYGEIKTLSIDDSVKEIKATLLLKGELQTLEVRIIGYNFTRVEDKGYMTFLKVSTSREWINKLLETHPPKELTEKRVEIPRNAAIAMKLIF
ncbi:MAG: hypothetical protein HBSAPP04_10870 [Ignavibacteriaceae bacterium]|nr:MAG: hypothetical protein EDM75_10700 [Chlorobiota bacterium]GJQ32248.1 MAG: hypothetical protein HBSAPP04_10870 [Ignavibacteriaceae bacterium]